MKLPGWLYSLADAKPVSALPDPPFQVGDLLLWQYEDIFIYPNKCHKKVVVVTRTFSDNSAIHVLVEGKVIALYNSRSAISSTLEKIEESE